jgi:hypothetical protein
MPYIIDSKVKGFPLGRYISIVPPSWLKAGLMRAEIRKIGSIYSKLNRIAFLPFKYMEYATAQISDIARQTGCMNDMENTRTSPKYRKLING